MLFRSILVPYDESEHAQSALHTAFGMVGDDEAATIHVVTVIPVGGWGSPVLSESAFDDPDAADDPSDMTGPIVHRVKADIEGAIERSRDGARCTAVAAAVCATSPVEGIADYISNHGIDLVIMGRRGLGALRGMLGSVSFGVLRSVETPVLTVK